VGDVADLVGADPCGGERFGWRRRSGRRGLPSHRVSPSVAARLLRALAVAGKAIEQAVLPELAVERRPVDAQDAGRRALVALRPLEGLDDREPLDLLERVVRRDEELAGLESGLRI